MWLRGSRREEPARELVEIVTPRTNTATITPAENLIAAIALPQSFSLEIAATRSVRWFLVRAGTPAMRRHLETQLGVAYPQAELRPLDLERYPGLDPAVVRAEEQVVACSLVLRAPAYLPLRTFSDEDVDAVRRAQADPVLGILAALHDLPEGWRALSQLVLRPAPDDWSQGYHRLAVEHPLARERTTGGADTSLTQVFALAALLVVGILAFQAYHWYLYGDWTHLAELAGSILVGGPTLLWLLRRLTARPIYDMRLVQEKVGRIAHVAQIRLAIIAPADVPGGPVQEHLNRLAAAYRQYNLASGNSLVPRRIDLRRRDIRVLDPVPSARSAGILNSRELAGLWHLPQSGADVSLVERTTARRLLPLPFSVARGCRIGVSAHQGRAVSVSLPDEVLRRHLLLVAKTRRGKSSLLLHLAQYVMEAQGPDTTTPSLVLIDPHQDLAQAALGLVPATRQGDAIFLDVSGRDRPFGLNLLDVGLGWDRDKAVSNALTIFRREFDQYWGPRMEDAFRFALLTLYEVNEAICAFDPTGRSRQHTVLDIPAVLVDYAFRQSLLDRVKDPVIKAWWRRYFDTLDRRLQIEIVNPVATKIQRYAGSVAARTIVGQPRSTIDPLGWVHSGAIVIVNTAKGTVGEGTSALLGGTVLNLVALAIEEQARLPVRERRSVTIIVDEFHTMPGADYESILAELSKYGANLVLATQSLARLETLDREQSRSLRSMVFANLDGLFAFHTSAEDARYLVPELGQEIDEQDLVALGEHQCYVKLSVAGERMPTFSVRLDPPPGGDAMQARELADISARRFGRDRLAVERDLHSAIARIDDSKGALRDEGRGEAGKYKDETPEDKATAPPGPQYARHQYRNRRHLIDAQQPSLPLPDAPTVTKTAISPNERERERAVEGEPA
ncbi:MAG TPA: hypothetical protein VFB58_05115 [Chloroflexota bacterium]|nr:hypothetical protein [Chloroflexota bacterium]